MKISIYSIERVARITFEIFLLIVVLFLIYANLSQYLFGSVVIAIVRGSSMIPLLKNGDIVLLTPTTNADIGDIIVFKNDRGDLVVHRVIAIIYCDDNRKLYVTKGDNDPIPDVYDIARRSSVKCNIINERVLPGFERYMFKIDRGIPLERVVGKVVEIGNIPVKISGLVLSSSR